jgi:hypothetical protein
VKVFEVECIVDGLVDGTTIIGLCPNLELDDQHRVANHKDVVGTFANMRDQVFKTKCSSRQVLE